MNKDGVAAAVELIVEEIEAVAWRLPTKAATLFSAQWSACWRRCQQGLLLMHRHVVLAPDAFVEVIIWRVQQPVSPSAHPVQVSACLRSRRRMRSAIRQRTRQR